MGHPPRIPVWLKPDQSVVYLLTFCAANRQKVLANDTTFAAFKAAVTRLTKWNVIAAILMPQSYPSFDCAARPRSGGR